MIGMKTVSVIVISLYCSIGLGLAGCKGSHHSEASDSAVAYDTVMPDTLVAEEDTIPKKMPLLRRTDEILEAMEESPDHARYAQGILPQMAKDVPEYAGKLLVNEADGFLIVDKNTMKLYRYDRYGVEQERVGIACAKNFGSKHKRRDGRTPEGYFTIEGIYDSTEWLFTDDDGNTSEVKGQFGPRYMRLRTPVSSQIGIHGTVAPWSIGGRRSHGCIRMTNENILRFAEICKAGWPVIVSPGPKDMAINEEEGYDIPSVAVVPGRPRCKPGKRVSVPDESPATQSQSPDSISTALATDSATVHTEKRITGSGEQELKEEGAQNSEPEQADPIFN